MKLTICYWLEMFFERLETFAGRMRWRVSFCPECGSNRFDGPPCVGRILSYKAVR